MLHSIYASPLYRIAQLFPGDILVIRIKGTACASRTGVLHLGFRGWKCKWSSLPEGCPYPGCRGWAQALRAALVQRTVWATPHHTHGAAPSEQAGHGKSKSPQHISGFASTGQQRVKNRAKNKVGSLKYSSFYPVSNSVNSLVCLGARHVRLKGLHHTKQNHSIYTHALVHSEILQVKNYSTNV